MKKIKDIILCILPLLAALAIQIDATIKCLIVYLFVMFIRDPHAFADSLPNLNPNLLLGISIVAASMCLFVFALWYNKCYVHKKIASYKELFTIKRIIYLILLAFGIQFGGSMIMSSISILKPEWFKHYNELMKSLEFGNSLISVFYAVIVAPFSEELVCRGVIFQQCKKKMPFVMANIMQALLFGIYHLNIVQGIYAFVFGLFMGYVCEKFQTIYASIFLHAMINLFACTIGWFVSGKIFTMPLLVILIIFVSIVTIVFSTIKIKNEKLYQDENDFNLA